MHQYNNSMEPNSFPILIVLSLLSCRSCVGSAGGKDIPGICGDDASATIRQRNILNNMLCSASFSFAIAFIMATTLPPSSLILDLTREPSEEIEIPLDQPKKPSLAVNRADSKPKISAVAYDADLLSVQFNGDDNSFVLSSSGSASASDVLFPRSGNSTTISTRRQRRAQETMACNYSDFCDNNLSRQIEAMVSEIESAHEDRRTKKINGSNPRRPSSEYSVAEELCQAASVETIREVIKEEAPTPISKDLYMKDVHYARNNNNSFHLLRRMLNRKLEDDDDVPAMRACDSMSLSSSEFSFSTRSSCTRSSCETLSMTPMQKSRHYLSLQPNAEWAIIE